MKQRGSRFRVPRRYGPGGVGRLCEACRERPAEYVLVAGPGMALWSCVECWPALVEVVNASGFGLSVECGCEAC